MRRQHWITPFLAILTWTTVTHAENAAKEIKKAVERSTLDQAGTKPFHLRAAVQPSFERDKASGRTGEIEIWWAAPTRWKKVLQCPNFRQVEIADGNHVWQKNEGAYFPEWLQRTAVELIKPVPPLDEVLEKAKEAELKQIGPMTNFNWTSPSGTAETPNILRSWVALDNRTGLLLYAGGLGWGAEFKDYSDFHGRMIARTVNVGTPQVTAKVSILEDLIAAPADLFDTTLSGTSDPPLRTVIVDEVSARKNLLPGEPATWPPVQDGPLEGKVTSQLVIDREGTVKEIGSLFSDNPGINEAGKQIVKAMRFKPFQQDGVPVQIISQFSIPFKTSRPAGTESFDSAHNYFERGRHLGFPAFGNGTPYLMRADFDAGISDKTIGHGQYEDTWLADSQWRREVRFGNSSYIRTRNGDKTYQFAEGPDVGLLRLVMKLIEPIPAIDTFVESDWRIKRDTVNGTLALRLLAGYESPEGKLDPEQAKGYWFDDNGLLIKTYFNGIESQRSDFQEYAGVKIAHHIEVFKDGRLGMHIHISELSPPGSTPAKMFELKGHEWTRAFTAEVR